MRRRAGWTRSLPNALTPLVGREREIGLLLERWEHAKAGMGQVVMLVGEGGIGKSRLVAVLKERVAAAAAAQVECRGSPLHQHSTLYPLIDFFHRMLHWQRHDTADEKLQKLEAALAQYGPALTETVPLFAALLSLPLSPARYQPLSLSPQQQKHKTFAALRWESSSSPTPSAPKTPYSSSRHTGHWEPPYGSWENLPLPNDTWSRA